MLNILFFLFTLKLNEVLLIDNVVSSEISLKFHFVRFRR